MQILNVGPLEFLFILILALVILGPERMIETARAMGKWFYRFTRSSFWASVVDTSREIRELPTKIVREAGLEESIKEINTFKREIRQYPVMDDLNQTAEKLDREIKEMTQQVYGDSNNRFVDHEIESKKIGLQDSDPQGSDEGEALENNSSQDSEGDEQGIRRS